MIKLQGFRISTAEIENKIINEVCVAPLINLDSCDLYSCLYLVCIINFVSIRLDITNIRMLLNSFTKTVINYCDHQ